MQLKKKHIDKLLILSFLVIIMLPSLFQITKSEENISNTENRKKDEFPKIKKDNLLIFKGELESYYKDNFGLKNTLSNAYLQFKYTVLHESPKPEKVIIGKDDFLFLGKKFSNVIDESFGKKFFTEKELIFKKERLLKRKKWLEDQKIAFYIAIVPNKHTLYKENFPFKYSYKTTRKEQLIDFMKGETNIEIIDLEKHLRPKKDKGILFRKLDSHWSELGAFYAYQAIIDEMNKDFSIEKLTLDSYRIESNETGGDISAMLNISDTERYLTLEPNFNDIIIKIDTPGFYTDKPISESRYKNPKKSLKVLLFRDSFASALIPYFNQTFGECTYIWSQNFDKELILNEKPDIVIMEYIERYLERF